MILILYHRCNNPLIQFLQDYILDCVTHIFAELRIPAIQVQYQKVEIFRISERHITNQKMIDKWGNAKIALPRHC